MDTPAQTNSALPQQGGDAGAVSDQSKTGEDYQNQQGSKQANQSTAKGSNDSKNTKNELYYTQTDGVTGRFDFDQNPAPLAAEPSCYKIARQSTKHMGIGTIALSDSGITKTNAALRGSSLVNSITLVLMKISSTCLGFTCAISLLRLSPSSCLWGCRRKSCRLR